MPREHEWIITPAVRSAWCRDIPPEHELIEWIKTWLPKSRTFLDCGAHVGSWTRGMAGHFDRILAFEAQPDTFAFLRLNCGDIETATLTNVALGDRCLDSIELRVVSEDGGGSSTQALPTHTAPLRSFSVPQVTIDSYGFDDVDFIKLDVEGAESSVLSGALETLRRCHWPKIIFEAWSYPWFHDRREALFAQLRNYGYRITPTTWPDTFIAERP